MRDGVRATGVDKPAPILVDTELAALYLLMHTGAKANVKLFREDELKQAKTRIYNLARDRKLKRHGGKGWGEARWDLRQLDRIAKQAS